MTLWRDSSIGMKQSCSWQSCARDSRTLVFNCMPIIVEFGRFAGQNRRQRGEGKPETINFLSFTHIAAEPGRGTSRSCDKRCARGSKPGNGRMHASPQLLDTSAITRCP